MQRIIDAEKSDLFDVLAYVAYAIPTLTREERALKAKIIISEHFNTRHQIFLEFVLSHYATGGIDELDKEKLGPMLRLKYHRCYCRPRRTRANFPGIRRFSKIPLSKCRGWLMEIIDSIQKMDPPCITPSHLFLYD